MNSQQFITILDLTKRTGTDQAVGLVEEVLTYAPEMEKFIGRPIPGTHYNARIRPLLTHGGAFRKANGGALPGASVYDQRRFNCYFFDSQLQVDEAVARGAEQQGDSLALLQAEEAEGAIRQKAIQLGQQIYAGHLIDANGFPGLIDYFNTYSTIIDQRTNAAIDLAVSAGGTGATCEIAWFVWMHPQGVHLLFGGNQGIDIKPWMFQQLTDPNDPAKKFMGWASNLSGFIGLSVASPFAIGMVKNIDNTISGGNYAHPLTDALIAQLVSKFPIGQMPNYVFMSRKSRAGLQQSRTVTLFGQLGSATSGDSGARSLVAPIPSATTDGIPIIPTDSILTGNNF